MAWTALTTCLSKRVNPDGTVRAPLVPVGATIANAVYDTTGVHIRESLDYLTPIKYETIKRVA